MTHQPFADWDEAAEARYRISDIRVVASHLQQLSEVAPIRCEALTIAGTTIPLYPSRSEMLSAIEVLYRVNAGLEQEYRQRQRREDADIDEEGA